MTEPLHRETEDLTNAHRDKSLKAGQGIGSMSQNSEVIVVNELLNESQLAERLQVTPWLLWSLRKQGLPYLKVGRAVRYRLDEVMEWCRRDSGSSNGAENDDGHGEFAI